MDVVSAIREPGCGVVGAPINFYIDGQLAKQTGNWRVGSQHLDIWEGVDDFATWHGDIGCMDSWCRECLQDVSCSEQNEIVAYIDDTECGSVVPGPFISWPTYVDLTVASSDMKPGCGWPGAKVRVELGGRIVLGNGVWFPGEQYWPLIARFTGFSGRWGDIDCKPGINSRDNLVLLMAILEKGLPSLGFGCARPGEDVRMRDTGTFVWGDLDCDGIVSTRDYQALIRITVGQIGLPVPGDCPVIGTAADFQELY
jgi:hypothetical protein